MPSEDKQFNNGPCFIIWHFLDIVILTQEFTWTLLNYSTCFSWMSDVSITNPSAANCKLFRTGYYDFAWRDKHLMFFLSPQAQFIVPTARFMCLKNHLKSAELFFWMLNGLTEYCKTFRPVLLVERYFLKCPFRLLLFADILSSVYSI